MARQNEAGYGLGELRRSAILYASGIGALVNFRVGGATVSGIVCGQEDWDEAFPLDRKNAQIVHEERLEKKLGARRFRLPPVLPPQNWSKSGSARGSAGKAYIPPALLAAPFPVWMHCPQCGRLAPRSKWNAEPGSAALYCQKCSSGQRKAWVLPVGFIMACAKGHLDEFPWHAHVGHKDPGCSGERGFLKLIQSGPGLGSLRVLCPACEASNSMGAVFDAAFANNMKWKCRGRRPWLDAEREDCDCAPRVMKCGASNLYYPNLVSALSIPPWSEDIRSRIGEDLWGGIDALWEDGEERVLKYLKKNMERLRYAGLTPEELLRKISALKEKLEKSDFDNLRPGEYQALELAAENAGDSNFEARREIAPLSLSRHLGSLSRVTRLREVRAMTGFSRIFPPDDERSSLARISSRRHDWLPAIEERGEGIFLTLPLEKLEEWEIRPEVIARVARVRQNVAAKISSADSSALLKPQPRFMLVHSLSHALMGQLTLDCGYSAASLKERLYVGADMAGILIYTASADSDGTLGGLQRQGRASVFENTFLRAIRSMEWRSCDPLCINGHGERESFSVAACHCCLLAPETACEEFNRFLDRGLLVGWPDYPDSGFFSDLPD